MSDNQSPSNQSSGDQSYSYARTSLSGWVVALAETGYEKSFEFTTPSGNSMVTVYQNKTDGKIVVLVTYPGNENWVAFYPSCGFWGGKYHLRISGEGAGWIEKTPAEMLAEDMLAKEADETEGEANGPNV